MKTTCHTNHTGAEGHEGGQTHCPESREKGVIAPDRELREGSQKVQYVW